MGGACWILDGNDSSVEKEGYESGPRDKCLGVDQSNQSSTIENAVTSPAIVATSEIVATTEVMMTTTMAPSSGGGGMPTWGWLLIALGVAGIVGLIACFACGGGEKTPKKKKKVKRAAKTTPTATIAAPDVPTVI